MHSSKISYWSKILLSEEEEKIYPYHRLEMYIFSGAFKTNEEVESEEVFKSVGIDKEGGLVFTLDTLQVHHHLLLLHLLVHHQCNQKFQASQITKTPLNNLDASLQVVLWRYCFGPFSFSLLFLSNDF